MARRRIDDEAWGELTVRLVPREDHRFDGIVLWERAQGSSQRFAGIRTRPKQRSARVSNKKLCGAIPSGLAIRGQWRFFRKQFQNCFDDDDYLEGSERAYKWAAKQKLDESVPLDAALDGDGFAMSALRVFQRTNLLSPFELMRVKRCSERQPWATAFVRGAAAFAAGEMEAGLRRMVNALKPHDAAKWTVVTYLALPVETGCSHVPEAGDHEALRRSSRPRVRIAVSRGP